MTCDAKMTHHKRMDNCKRILELLQRNRTMQIKKIAKKLKIDDGTVYRHLWHLSNQQKVYYDKGVAYLKEIGIIEPGSAEAYFNLRSKDWDGGFYKRMGFAKKEGEIS